MLVVCQWNITSCPKTCTDGKYFSFSKPLPQPLKNDQDVCDMFVTCEFIIWNTMAKESQWHCFLPNSLCWFHLKGSEWCWWISYKMIWTHSILFYRLWVILQNLWRAVITSSPTIYKYRRLAACHAGLVVQKMTLSKFVYGQQYVSNIANIPERLFYIAFVPYDWLTGCEWH